MINILREMSAAFGGADISRPVPPCGCDADPIAGLKRLFVDYAQGLSLAAGRDPATRPVFLKLHGVAAGQFVVADDLRPEMRIGLFGQAAAYPAWVRFSSDAQPGTPDANTTVGIGIKLFGVAGAKLLAPDENATTHDFVLQNHDVFFVDDAAEMCEFTCLSLNGRLEEFLNAHPRTRRILADMEKFVPTVLGSNYWSVVPYRWGPDRWVKYKLEPESTPGAANASALEDPRYLRADLRARLSAGDSRFRFLIQLQSNDADMPLDRATVPWCEDASPPIHVGTLILPRQDVEVRNQRDYGENLAMNPWHALPEHEPAGSISAARKVVYAASANIRRHFNGIPLGEPTTPRPQEWAPGTPYPPGKDAVIVRAAIHPAIGVARLGPSEEYLIGPEVVPHSPAAATQYRDAAGALKRQAARFRVFGYNAAGDVVRELTASDATIQWHVHVANRKAAWFQWTMALDVPEAAGSRIPLRNASVPRAQRGSLVIDPGPKSISGRNMQGAPYELVGNFQGTRVSLGEIRSDDAGRLIFLGGRGTSASPTGTSIYDPSKPNAFINADGWYDDAADGPVTADVTVDGRSVPVEGAWIVTGPPNYAPHVQGVRTLYDLLIDLFTRANWLQLPPEVSFRRDVYPILQRLSDLQWTNSGYAAQFGHGAPHDFGDERYVAQLARDPSAQGGDLAKPMRMQVFHSFRDPAGADSSPLPWPWIYGDAMDDPPADTPRQHATISATQYAILRKWAAGSFVPDWQPAAPAPTRIEELPLQERPAMIDRAALDYCLADAFHPGCEVTWPIRHLTMYSAPFRIRRRDASAPEPDYGDTLTPEIALSTTGPLVAQGPGDLTKWMGLPWQADTAFCQSGYHDEYDPFIPSFWPARVPNHVLTRTNYQIAIDAGQPRAKRVAAFIERYKWVDPLSGSTAAQMAQMVRIFGDMGLLELENGVPNDPELPPLMMVASFGPGVPEPASSFDGQVMRAAGPAPGQAEAAIAGAQEGTLPSNFADGAKSPERAEQRPIPVHRPQRLP